MKNIIVGIGEALWDVFPEGKKIGGAPANFAYHVSQFGLESYAISAMGKDALGDEMQLLFAAKHIRNYLPQVDYPTGTVQVSLDKRGVPCYDIRQGVAWDNIPFNSILEEMAQHTCAVCFGSLAQRNAVSHQTINKFLDAMPADENRLRIFDINLRQSFYSREIIEASFHRCNILKINDEELVTVAQLFGYSGNVREKCRILLTKYNLKMLILTCGAEGSFVFTRDAVSYLKTPKVKVIDTVGSGDSFTAAFCASLLKGKTVVEAHHTAVKVSAFVCTQSGAMPDMAKLH